MTKDNEPTDDYGRIATSYAATSSAFSADARVSAISVRAWRKHIASNKGGDHPRVVDRGIERPLRDQTVSPPLHVRIRIV